MSSAKLATAISADDHAQGPVDAAITLVQYGDYECPYTRLSRHSVHQLQREFPDSLRFVFRHFPLEEIHPHACAASAAAEAAALQTDFWTMHDYLFEHQQALEDADLKRYVVELSLDSGRFARDRTSPEVETRIERDLASGERSGVPGTPTFYVNGIRHDGGYDLESLRSAILTRIDGRAHAHSRHAGLRFGGSIGLAVTLPAQAGRALRSPQRGPASLPSSLAVINRSRLDTARTLPTLVCRGLGRNGAGCLILHWKPGSPMLVYQLRSDVVLGEVVVHVVAEARVQDAFFVPRHREPQVIPPSNCQRAVFGLMMRPARRAQAPGCLARSLL